MVDKPCDLCVVSVTTRCLRQIVLTHTTSDMDAVMGVLGGAEKSHVNTDRPQPHTSHNHHLWLVYHLTNPRKF